MATSLTLILVVICLSLFCTSIQAQNQTENECSENKDCEKPKESYECENGVCVCSKFDVYTSDPQYKCLKLSNINSTCEIDDQCNYLTNHSKCTNGICKCIQGFVYLAYKNECKPEAKPFKLPASLLMIPIICVVVIVLGCILCIICCCCCCKKKKNNHQVGSE